MVKFAVAMNSKIKRFHQIILGCSVLGMMAGLLLWRLEDSNIGAAVLFLSGCCATFPLFYFASQVAFVSRKDEDGDDR
jgi:hypothetical protein